MTPLAWLHFDSPGYLTLLALIPLIIALSYRSLAGLGPIRKWVAIGFRSLVLLVIILALAGLHRTEEVDDLTVIFLVDSSKSVPSNLQREAFKYLRNAAEGLQTDDRIGVIGFNGVADVEQTPMKALGVQGLRAVGQPDQTDLAGAIRLALALLPPDSAGRIVIVTDGNENVGSVLQEAEQYKAAGIPIDILPIEYEHANEVVFEQLKAPATGETDETINLQLVLRSQRRVSGKIMLNHGNDLVDLAPDDPQEAGYAVTLDPGPNRITIPRPLNVQGTHQFEATFLPDDPESDTVAENNTGRALTRVFGQGKILILTEAASLRQEFPSAEILADALERERLAVDIFSPEELTLEQSALLDYSLVVLDNVNAGAFRDAEKEALALYVRELGGGLIMLGGENSFGAGGWQNSAIEEVMPVSFEVKHKKEFLRGALCLVMHACEVPDGNYLGQRAAIDAVKTLSSRDLIGVLAWKWQDDQLGYWVVQLQEVGTRSRIINSINKMSMGDMPDLDAVMRPGVEALVKRKDVGPKHMIVISDFDPSPPGNDLIKTMKDNGITCTTIAIGYGGHAIDERKANWIAKSTGGRFYRTNDHSKIPQIFINESREIRRTLIQEGEFTPAVANSLSPLMAGMRSGFPELRAFVLSTAKTAATVPLVHHSEEGDDPVLAHWQAGLGKVIAFTSGDWARWGPEWASWEEFSRFWAQAIRWASRQSEAAGLDITTTVQGGRTKIRIDAVDKNVDAVKFLEVVGKVITPDNQAVPLRLTQTGPGRVEGEFESGDRGNYILDLRYRKGAGANAQTGLIQTGVSIAYSPEFAQMKANLPLLQNLREKTAGRDLRESEAIEVFDRSNMEPAQTRHVMWESLLRWMLLLFLLDVAIRRIAINPKEVGRKGRRFVSEMAGRQRDDAQAEVVLTSLKGTRERVRDEARERAEQESAPAATARYEAQQEQQKATDDLGRALGGATSDDAPVVARPTGKKPAQSEADYTSRLLKAKRRARDDMRKEQDDQDK
jgi:uncharacterized membrane protein